MPAIPPTGDFPKATIDKDTFHAKFLAVHAYLTGLLGSDGVVATARAQLGLVLGSAHGQVSTNGTKSATEALAGLVELATQAEAEDGTLDDVVMTPLKTAQAIAASPVLQYKSDILTTGSDTWTVPAGVTSAFVVVIGGGGGGGDYYGPETGGAGGVGGQASGFVTLVPGDTHIRTVGVGGAGSNAGGGGGGYAGSGVASSFGTLLTASGGSGGQSAFSGGNGAAGVNGVGSGGTLTNGNVANTVNIFGGTTANQVNTFPVVWTPASYSPGSRGSGGNATYTYGGGGYGGIVAIFYVGP